MSYKTLLPTLVVGFTMLLSLYSVVHHDIEFGTYLMLLAIAQAELASLGDSPNA